jgi:hypothetical protein
MSQQDCLEISVEFLLKSEVPTDLFDQKTSQAMTNEHDLSILLLYLVNDSLEQTGRRLTSALRLVNLISDNKCLA